MCSKSASCSLWRSVPRRREGASPIEFVASTAHRQSGPGVGVESWNSFVINSILTQFGDTQKPVMGQIIRMRESSRIIWVWHKKNDVLFQLLCFMFHYNIYVLFICFSLCSIFDGVPDSRRSDTWQICRWHQLAEWAVICLQAWLWWQYRRRRESQSVVLVGWLVAGCGGVGASGRLLELNKQFFFHKISYLEWGEMDCEVAAVSHWYCWLIIEVKLSFNKGVTTWVTIAQVGVTRIVQVRVQNRQHLRRIRVLRVPDWDLGRGGGQARHGLGRGWGHNFKLWIDGVRISNFWSCWSIYR